MPVRTEEPVAIESINSDDKDLTLLSPRPVSVLGKSDINETVIIVADLLVEDAQNVKADLSTGSVVKDKIVEAKLSDADYSSGVSQRADIGTKVDIPIEEPLKADTDVFSLSVQDDLLIQDRQVSITKDSKDMLEKSRAVGSDTFTFVKEEPVELAAPPQEAQYIITSAETKVSAPTEIAKARRFPGLEIMKSIVDGGLIESITSLGVVSSAAAAATLVAAACWAAAVQCCCEVAATRCWSAAMVLHFLNVCLPISIPFPEAKFEVQMCNAHIENLEQELQ